MSWRWFIFAGIVLLVIFGENRRVSATEAEEKVPYNPRIKRNNNEEKEFKQTKAIDSQPRMYTENGNLFFATADTFDITFQTVGSGSVKVNDKDLVDVMAQIDQNKADIEEIQNSGTGGVPPGLQDQVDDNTGKITTIQSQINNHNDRLDTLESQYTELKDTVDGIKSDLENDNCSPNPCKNGGTCTDLYKSFLCTCPRQYEGQTCGQDHNECLDFQATGIGCQNGGTCVNLPGGFQCNCPSNYYGPLCTSMYDDCFDGDAAKCVHGICVNTPRQDANVPKYTCICEAGWTNVSASDPTCSRDIDECLNNPCSSNPPVQCYNTQGSFTCGMCPNGYEGNGFTCTDVNECLTNNGGCSQSPPVQCINIPGSSYCGPCPSGYTGDGYSCTQQDPCSNNGGCHPVATCSYNPAIGSVSCTCPPGYNGNGVGPFGCTLVQSNCTTETCINGQCVAMSGVLQCICDPGWIGDTCDYNNNECASNPCQNGGTCNDGVNGYTCSCTSAYTGLNCEMQQTSCGGNYETASGAFQFPASTGETYPHGASCMWTVTVAEGKVIAVTFPQFDIEEDGECRYDYLQINDGGSISSQLLGKFCGTTPPGDPLVSSSHRLFFWFFSDGDTAGEGFQVVWQTQDPVCGGHTTGETFGSIMSPGYPGVYPGHRDCYWTISVQPGNVIQFLFGTVALEHHENCTYDWLEIRDGILLTDPVLARYCSTVSPPPLLTTAPGGMVHFHSDPYVGDTGFHITWTTQPVGISGCGGYFTDDDGVIISPNWPNTYNNQQQCVWQIHIQENGQIALTFTDLDIETDDNCQFDYLEVRDGPDESAALVARYCGSVIPPMVTSSDRDLYMKFKSDPYVGGRGFRTTYTVACGGTYTDETGVLLSPYYPSVYPHNKECFYTIRQPPGYIITLMFDEIDIEPDPNCYYDYIKAYDGPTDESPLLSQVCGVTIPAPVMSTQNYMYLHFYTDGADNAGGFRATYTSSNTGCGGVYTNNVGSLRSPGHPSPYPHGVNCTYYIWVDPSLIINLQFLTFALESPNANGDCVVDYLEVFDGPDMMAPSLGRFCGSTTPPSLVSSSFELTVFFTTNDDDNDDGFAAAYNTLNASTACGGRITDQEGIILSPNYPDDYPNLRTCIWTFEMPSSMQIQVDFPDFEFEAGNAEDSCDYDYLEIRNGGYEDSPLIGQFCGARNPGTFISHSSQLYMKMVTDQDTPARGFVMNYNGGLTGCGGTLTSADGGFQSPNYPFPYDHAAECFWLIQVSEGSSVRLVFVNFDIETHGFCEFDFVEAYDGPTDAYPSLGRVCGTRIPEPYESNDNSMLVKFRSDGNTAGSGFLAQYHSNCDRTITSKSSGLIQSLNYPGNYPPNRDCTWTIQGTLGNPIKATFRSFSIETCDNCNCDYLQLYDGNDPPNSESFGTFCGDQLPPMVTSSGRYLQLVFHTDPYLQSKGFEMAWTLDGCGDTFTAASGTFTSPNYPNNYPDNKECIWQIIAVAGTYVQLTITDFNVEHHPTCDYDTLEIFNGLYVDTDYRIAQLCNADSQSQPQLPMQVSSSSSFMTVRFITDYLVNGRGFQASYQQKPGGCGGFLTSKSGTIMSPSYPNTYPANTDCEWYIDVGKGSTVVITFEAFDIEEEAACEYDYVAMFDGNTTSDPLLLKACGRTLPPDVQSYDNLMLLQFHSDPYTAHSGFKAHYSAGCGGKLVASAQGSAEISTPNYPGVYPADQNCTWTITSEKGGARVTLQFTHMDLYTDPYYDGDCGPYDYVQLLDGRSTTSPEYGIYCGTTLPASLTAFGDAFTILFVSQSEYQQTGFRILYTSSQSECGGELTGRSGYFNSPAFPQPYPPDIDCVWIIRSSPGNRIQLTFLMFSLEPHDQCNFDYVDIREGSADGTSLARLCGDSLPSNVSSITGHILYVKFHSDISGVGPGFQAYYQHVYGSTTIGRFSDVIASPMYPGVYPDMVDAYYYVYAPAGRHLEYAFSMLDMEPPTEEGCVYDYLVIYDGDTKDFPWLHYVCGTQTRPQGRTTQGAMLMWFHSDWGHHARGFYMMWVAVEGGGIPPNPTNVPTIEPGVCGSNHMVAALAPLPLYSPGWPGNYPNNQDCEWLIEAAQGYRVELTVLTIDIESGGLYCSFDGLLVYDGVSPSSSLIGSFCGKYAPDDPVYSSAEFMLVRMRSDVSVNYGGFSATYQQACGGTITGDQGVVSSPNYPGNYPVNTDCVWVIAATIGHTISLDFNIDFEISNTDPGQCSVDRGDYLLLLNGRDADSPPLTTSEEDVSGRYCGTQQPTGLVTTSNYMYVHFMSDGKDTAKGFSFTYSATGPGCGGELSLTDQLTSGTFSSPDYPSAYPHGADCIWIITAPAGEAVQLDFTTFSLEGGSTCQYDYVLVVDGRTSDDTILGRFCSNAQPPTSKSSGTTMLVRFRTDPTVSAGGFQAVYKLAECGGTLVGTSGVMTSPNYPNNYPDSMTCEWVVRVPAYHFIHFEFTQLNLPDNNQCGNGDGDFVEIRTLNSTGPLLVTACGAEKPSLVETPDNTAFVRFRADDSDNDRGFRLTFVASEDICGGELSAPGGTLSSPNYPNSYDHARVCTWLITVAVDRRITLEFHEFDVEDPHETAGCAYDYVEVYNGILPNSPRLTRRCGKTLPPNYESSGNTMKVIFVTDASISNGGFLATYSSTEPRVCGGLLNDPAGGTFMTPNYPENYGNNQECIWTIYNTNLHNSSILVKFKEFSLEHHIICDWDRVTFKAGSDYSGYLYKTLCGDTKPAQFGMAFPDAFVQFTSDISVSDKGFEATYEFRPCGGLVVGTRSGVIASPNYPEPYNNNDFCTWTIAAPFGHQIKLHFTNFTVESHSSCGYDYVKIYNGPTTDSPLVDTYCNNNKPTDFTAASDLVTIVFQSDYSVPQDGWRLEWTADASGCGNIVFHDPSGVIMSPGYPDVPYAANLDCLWTMIMDPAYHLDVTFDAGFGIETHEGCRYDYVALYDGGSENTKELDRFCGFYDSQTGPSSDTNVESSTEKMTMRFRSDFSGSGPGFKGYYEAHCGQIRREESGIIQTPNYPSPYNNNEHCNFLITYPDGSVKFIKLTFNAFSLEGGSNLTVCDYDYVAVYAGGTTDDRLIGQFCGNRQPTTPLSSENKMLVEFNADPYTIDYGFQADFESSDCGGLLENPSGSINAFTHSNIHNNRNCTWRIQVDDVKIVELEFTSFDLETHVRCEYDYVKVYDGPSTQSPLIGTYCGTFAPKYLLSTSNTMTIEFITDDMTNGNGFTSYYRQMAGPQEGCGGTLTEATGTFSSVDLDSDGNYDANLNCLWVIQAPDENQVITITFSEFKLENGTNSGCQYDRLQIHDGQTMLDPVSVSACGIIVPAPFTSSSNFLSIRFLSDPYVEDTGFIAEYSTQTRTCGGHLQTTENFQSLQYPDSGELPQNIGCRWTLDAGTDLTKYIMVTFDSVDIQSASNSGTNCNAAYVEVKDYPPSDVIQVFRYCSNSHAPVDFHSFGQIVQVNLRTDGVTTGQGISLQYKTTDCNRDISQPYGQLFSPGWPSYYPHDSACITVITVAEGNQIQMFFNSFEMEVTPQCYYDYLMIRDGPDENAAVIQKLCGFALPNPIFPTTNSVYMKLQSDESVHNLGYDITYTSTPEICGGNITGASGSVTSFMFPQAYPPNSTCEFSIRAPEGRPVTVHIRFLDIYYTCEGGCRCMDDVLWVHGGPDRDSPIIAGYCGYGTIADLQSPVNSAYVRFLVGDFEAGSRTNTGFRIEFES